MRCKEGFEVQLVKGSILDQKVDVITNAANNGLKHAGGIAGVIVRAAGQEL
jgi:O-acetyl-ADP-ribose deacetylase (regulator of RNase III)